jgi:hypothetical protein
MKLNKQYQLTYCTNIHPGEDWDSVMQTLDIYVPRIKAALSPDAPFGIGLRLSRQAADQLKNAHHLATFKNWLAANDCYVFTMNGFPYGGFHRQRVKDDVHQPDWTTEARYEYTRNLFHILSELLPDAMDGGISTSPISYKYWHKSEEEVNAAMEKGVKYLSKLAWQLHGIRKQHGQFLHLDIVPEPDGLLEDTETTVDFYEKHLLPHGIQYLEEKHGMSAEEAEECLREHIRVCYDVCHFAVMYEEPEAVFQRFEREDIRIGKVQISAALKAYLPQNSEERKLTEQAFQHLSESTYLHQVVAAGQNSQRQQYPDLPDALEHINDAQYQEWRTHFHVPVFLENYGLLQSTQDDVLKTFQYLQTHPVTHHLEVETYTWEVLPEEIRIELGESIARELQWVRENFEQA